MHIYFHCSFTCNPEMMPSEFALLTKCVDTCPSNLALVIGGSQDILKYYIETIYDIQTMYVDDIKRAMINPYNPLSSIPVSLDSNHVKHYSQLYRASERRVRLFLTCAQVLLKTTSCRTTTWCSQTPPWRRCARWCVSRNFDRTFPTGGRAVR